MLVNTYTALGPQNTLIAIGVVGALKVPERDFEGKIPTVSSIYDHRKSTVKFNDIAQLCDFSITTLDAPDLNTYGVSCIQDRRDRLTAKFYAQSVENKEPCYIKHVKKPELWHERLLVMMTLFYRRRLLESISDNRLNLLELEADYNKHLDVLANFQALPPMYNWERSMAAFKNVFPRPLWYIKEMQTVEKMNRGL